MNEKNFFFYLPAVRNSMLDTDETGYTIFLPQWTATLTAPECEARG